MIKEDESDSEELSVIPPIPELKQNAQEEEPLLGETEVH